MMKTFMAVYVGTPAAFERSRWSSMDEAQRKAAEAEGLKAWHDWMAKHAAIIVDGGGPLGKTKRASAQGVSDTRNDLAGYVVVRAESHEAAAKLFLNHPHFSIFPGDAVEVMEVMPIPGRA